MDAKGRGAGIGCGSFGVVAGAWNEECAMEVGSACRLIRSENGGNKERKEEVYMGVG